MKNKRVRVLMPAAGRDYVTAADLLQYEGETALVSNIAGCDPALTMGLDSSRILGRKRSGRRGARQKGAAK